MDSNKKIFLLVDDDNDDRELFMEAIQTISSQIKCHLATDGQDALDLLGSFTDELPDVIFLDINMPVMNGWNFLRAIKLKEEYKNIPVIMYSTSSNQREVDTAIDMGALCFCLKTEKFSSLKQILETVIKNLGANLLQELKQNNNTHFRFKKAELTG